MQYAVVLSQTLNFSQAAEQLGITQPALSKQIQSLETELGVKLFERSHSPLTLTAAGEYFIAHAQELLYKEDLLYRTLRQFGSGESGRLSIGVTPFRSHYLMPEILKKFRLKYPNVKVTLHEVSNSQLRKESAEGKYDFAIVNLPVDISIVDAIPLEPDTLVLAVPHTMLHLLPNLSGNALTTADFRQAEQLPFVVLGPGQDLRRLFDNLCSTAGFSPVIAAEVTGVTTALSMAHAGVGATILPLQLIRNQYFDENLVLLPIKDSLYYRQPAVVTRKGQFLSDYAKYAIELLTASSDQL